MPDTRFGRRDPNARGYYGEYGGKFVPKRSWRRSKSCRRRISTPGQNQRFLAELDRLLAHYVGRPTPIYETGRLPASLGKPAARIFLKREDLAHTGAHKINNALGQALLAKRMGKRRIVAETGAGQHGVATATACALLGLECHVYMGAEDMERQALNVVRMRLLGATVRRVDAGSKTLKDAINEAMRDWVTNVTDTYYLLGSVLGPHPYPLMVREFQAVIGREARAQILTMTGRLPDAVVACVGGGSNAIGIFDAFIPDKAVRLIGVEAGGEGSRTRQACGPIRRRHGRRAAGDPNLRASGSQREHRADPFHFGGPRLRRGWTRARLAARPRTRGVHLDWRRRSAGGVSAPGAARGHHPGAGIGSCDRLCVHAGAGARRGRARARESVGARRQGRSKRCQV